MPRHRHHPDFSCFLVKIRKALHLTRLLNSTTTTTICDMSFRNYNWWYGRIWLKMINSHMTNNEDTLGTWDNLDSVGWYWKGFRQGPRPLYLAHVCWLNKRICCSETHKTAYLHWHLRRCWPNTLNTKTTQRPLATQTLTRKGKKDKKVAQTILDMVAYIQFDERTRWKRSLWVDFWLLAVTITLQWE